MGVLAVSELPSYESAFQQYTHWLNHNRSKLLQFWNLTKKKLDISDPGADWSFRFMLNSLSSLHDASEWDFFERFRSEWIQNFKMEPSSSEVMRWLSVFGDLILQVLKGVPDAAGFLPKEMVSSFFGQWSQYMVDFDSHHINRRALMSQLFQYPAGSVVVWFAVLQEKEGIYQVKYWQAHPNYEDLEFHSYKEFEGFQSMDGQAVVEQLARLVHGTHWQDKVTLHSTFWKNQRMCVAVLPTSSPMELTPMLSFASWLLRIEDVVRNQSRARRRYIELQELYRTLSCCSSLKDVYTQVSLAFVKFFPFTRCAIFSYHPGTRIIQGEYGINVTLSDVRAIHGRLYHSQAIETAIRYQFPNHVADAKGQLPNGIVRRFSIQGAWVIPLIGEEGVNGFVVADHGGQRSGNRVSSEVLPLAYTLGLAAGYRIDKGDLLSQGSQDGASITGVVAATVMLTQRELDVLRGMADGKTSKEVATQLHISEFTVRDHVQSAMLKLHAKNKTQAVAIAIKSGLL